MPVPSKVAHPDRRGLGDYPPRPAVKPSYSPNINLTDTHRCASPTPVPVDSVFTQANEELWSDCPAPVEHHDLLPTREHPPQKKQRHQHQTPPTHGTSHEELTRLSARPYDIRASDPSDFASTWESSIVPLLTDLLQKRKSSPSRVQVVNSLGRVASRAFVPKLLPSDSKVTNATKQTAQPTSPSMWYVQDRVVLSILLPGCDAPDTCIVSSTPLPGRLGNDAIVLPRPRCVVYSPSRLSQA